MVKLDSIHMFFGPTNRLQPLFLPPDHHGTHFGHTFLGAVTIFSKNSLEHCYMCYHGTRVLYSYVFWPNKSIETIIFTPKQSRDGV